MTCAAAVGAGTHAIGVQRAATGTCAASERIKMIFQFSVSGVKTPNVKSVQEGKFFVFSSSTTDLALYADAQAYAAMSAAMPITGPIEDWFAKILHGCDLLSLSPAAENSENYIRQIYERWYR